MEGVGEEALEGAGGQAGGRGKADGGEGAAKGRAGPDKGGAAGLARGELAACGPAGGLETSAGDDRAERSRNLHGGVLRVRRERAHGVQALQYPSGRRGRLAGTAPQRVQAQKRR